MADLSERPELTMVKRALMPAILAFGVAIATGWAVSGSGAGWSAGIGVAVVACNFAVHGLSLAWASTVSLGVVMAVALGGFVVRLGVIVAAMFALNALHWFSPSAFGLAVVPSTLLLLAFEAKLMTGGLGASLQIPADPAAVRGASLLAAREASN